MYMHVLYIHVHVFCRSLCALANDEAGGCVYVGVASNGVVHGIPLERIQVINNY